MGKIGILAIAAVITAVIMAAGLGVSYLIWEYLGMKEWNDNISRRAAEPAEEREEGEV